VMRMTMETVCQAIKAPCRFLPNIRRCLIREKLRNSMAFLPEMK
jgi:hypothetical protein